MKKKTYEKAVSGGTGIRTNTSRKQVRYVEGSCSKGSLRKYLQDSRGRK
jgi:hypothetical protein